MSGRFNRLLSDGIIIVVSILIAFAIDAWWGERKDRIEEQRLLESLKVEFISNIRVLPDFIETHRMSAHYAKKFAKLLKSTPTGGSFNFNSAELAQIINHPSTDPQTGVIDIILQSGELRYITNPEIRGRLAAWPTYIIDATENESLLRTLWEPRLLEALGEQSDLSAIAELTTQCWQDPALEECREDTTQISRSTMVISILGPVMGYAAEAARELELLKQEAEEIVDLIDSELATSQPD
jgi:hypothetical protein